MTFCQDLTKVAIAVCDAIGTKKSDAVKQLVLRRDWVSLTQVATHPSDYQTPGDYFRDACATEMFRKLDGLETGIDLHQRALDVFWDCERECHRTNQKLARYVRWKSEGVFFHDQFDTEVWDLLSRAKSFIRRVLGPLPVKLSLSLGKGATYHDKGTQSTIAHKFSSRPTRTAGAWWTEYYYSETKWGMATLTSQPVASAPLVIKGNRFTSVPKDSSKNRGICVEPSLNLAYQLPLGSLLKRKLRDAGIDLWTGQDKHRDLARRASIDGDLATIDLSNASDTIALQLVKLLLPSAWYDLFESLRSPYTNVEGKWVKLEKFSSMGNGFTFELETLIFLSLCVACAERAGRDGRNEIASNRLTVYGDDIIVPCEYVHDVLAALRFSGFTPNPKKTFIEGPFRESCGGDFFSGVDVRPFYLKELPNEPSQWIRLANGLRSLDVPQRGDVPRLGLMGAWHRCLAPIPADIRRIRGPRSLGDIVIHDDAEYWDVIVDSKDPQQRLIRTYQPVNRKLGLHHFNGDVQLACALFGVPSSGIVPRSSVKGYKKRWTPLLEVVEL